MPYIGQPLNAGNLSVQTGTGDGSDTTPIAALNYSVGSSESVAIYLDGVKQAVSTYVASGTVLTFTTAPPNGVGIEVVFLALSISLPTPGDGSVTAAKIADNAVGLAQLASGTDGELITWDASGNPAAVAVGTATHVLTSNGAGAAPTFQAGAAGNTPSFSVRLSANQSIPNNAYTKVVFDSENWDTNSAFASGTFTVPSGQAGKYMFVYHLNIGLLDSAKTILSRMYVNGTVSNYTHFAFVSPVNNFGAHLLVATVMNLSVGDTVEPYCYQNNGGALNALATGNEFSGFKLIGV